VRPRSWTRAARARDGARLTKIAPSRSSLGHLRDAEPQAGLARSSRARERDEPRGFLAEERRDCATRAAADERRGGRQRPGGARRGGARGSDPAADRPFQLLRGARLEPRSSRASAVPRGRPRERRPGDRSGRAPARLLETARGGSA
jgi:hypothetical protein